MLSKNVLDLCDTHHPCDLKAPWKLNVLSIEKLFNLSVCFGMQYISRFACLPANSKNSRQVDGSRKLSWKDVHRNPVMFHPWRVLPEILDRSLYIRAPEFFGHSMIETLSMRYYPYFRGGRCARMFPRNLEFPESFYVSGLIQKRKPNERQLKMIYIYVPFPTKILNSVASTSTFASISFLLRDW